MPGSLLFSTENVFGLVAGCPGLLSLHLSARNGTNYLMWFEIADIQQKLRSLPEELGRALQQTSGCREIPNVGRDPLVVLPSQLPDKPGLASLLGQARLLHDLASIELQAMELAVRTLVEFPQAPPTFRNELAEIALGEGKHLGLCLKGLEQMGYKWGDWPVHNSLWNAVGPSDTLLDRIVIVHRYLEGSGLDAGDMILRRLSGVKDFGVRSAMKVITDEEVDHVLFGSRWFQKICKEQKLDPDQEFISRLDRVSKLVPRNEKIVRDLRLKAGFTVPELDALEAVRKPAGRSV